MLKHLILIKTKPLNGEATQHFSTPSTAKPLNPLNGAAIYYVSLGSFDTHINQEGQQKRLFQELNDAIADFAADMKSNGKWQDVLLTTFSEFGRRVAQNASGGTDHGTANNMLFVGGGLRQKGLLNAMPDLSDLDQGDLRHQIDFRRVYAILLEKWLEADAEKILLQPFPLLNFV